MIDSGIKLSTLQPYRNRVTRSLTAAHAWMTAILVAVPAWGQIAQDRPEMCGRPNGYVQLRRHGVYRFLGRSCGRHDQAERLHREDRDGGRRGSGAGLPAGEEQAAAVRYGGRRGLGSLPCRPAHRFSAGFLFRDKPRWLRRTSTGWRCGTGSHACPKSPSRMSTSFTI